MSPEGVTTILCVGDSFTFGLRVKDDKKYPAILERLLNDHSAVRKYRVVNAGRPSASSGFHLSKLDRWIRRYRPDVVVVMSGYNCNDHDIVMHRENMGGSAGLWKTKLSIFINRFKTYRMIKYASARLSSIPTEQIYRWVLSMDLYNFREYQIVGLRNLGMIAEKLKRRRLSAVFVTYPQPSPPKNPYTDTEYYHYLFGDGPISEDDYLIRNRGGKIAINAIIEYVAHSYSIPVADAATSFSAREDQELYIAGDHHPNADGNEVLAMTVYQTLRKSKIVN
ncbi:MAG: hypothetical protein JXO72_00215 [Vicinamibacteria bacterium]|nr:hypothetical protein [Vicinamibacteria bacterium]